MRVSQKSVASVVALVGLLFGAHAGFAALINISNPLNILAGTDGVDRTVTVSSVNPAAGVNNKSAVIDNLAPTADVDDSFIFANGPTNTLSINGFNAGFYAIRIFTAFEPSRDAVSIIVRSSSSLTTSLTAGSYEQPLGPGPLGTGAFSGPFISAGYLGTTSLLQPYPVASPPPASSRGYYELVLTTPAPIGTQSLFIEFTNLPAQAAQRVYEVQALSLPEPSSLSLIGAVATMALRRKRHS